MKKLHYLTLISLFIFNISQGQSVTREISQFKPELLNEEQILYLKDSTKGIPLESDEEQNYIAYGISNVGFSNVAGRI
jgi:hypothetical protein